MKILHELMWFFGSFLFMWMALYDIFTGAYKISQKRFGYGSFDLTCFLCELLFSVICFIKFWIM